MNLFDKQASHRQEGAGVILRGAFPLILSNGLLFLLRIVNAIILVRILSQTEYGLYRQYYLLFDTAIMFFWMGLSSSMLYFIPRLSERESKPFVSQTLIISSVAGLLSFAAILCAQKPIGIYLNAEIVRHLFTFAAFVGFTVGSYFFENLLIAEKRTVFSAVFSVLYYLALFSCVLAVAYAAKNASAVFYALMPLAFFRYLWVVLYVVRRYGLTPALDRSLIKKHVTYCAPMVVASFLSTFALSADKYFVSVLYGSQVFALYVIGCLQLPISHFVSSPVSQVALPLMAKLEQGKNHHEIAVVYREIIRKNALVYLPVAAFFLFAARDFVSTAFGLTYVQAAPVLRLYVLAVIPEIFVVELIFSVFARTGFIWAVNLTKLVAIAVFASWFNSIGGYVGIAAAFALSSYIGLVFALSKIRTLLIVTKEDAQLFFRGLTKNAFVAVAALLPLFFIHQFTMPGTLTFLIINGFVYFLGYGSLASFLGALKKQDIDSLKSLCR